ncbi:MAG: DUF4329 domain-containing protein [Actinomycetota bacterium]|nr:DUF4329 domain-containing protein [Actinomycetota bacterium]
MLGVTDSELVDRALESLANELEEQAERAALEAHPYEKDPDLAWHTQAGPDLPYDGEVPQEVIDLAATLRVRRQRR